MNVKTFLFMLFLLLLTTVSISADEQKLTLAQNGNSDYAIILPNEASAVQQSAARELQTFFKEITGISLPINHESDTKTTPDSKHFVIGPSATSARLIGTGVDETKYGYDTILIKRVGNCIVFSGHPKRGPLYSVYTFLEDYLKCRWWTSKESTIPRQSTIAIGNIDIHYTPKLIYRESFYRDSYNGTFAVREKCNGSSNQIPPELGGHHSFQYFVHSFYPLIPPEKYYNDHPDWFPEIDGVRKVGHPGWAGMSQERKAFFDKLDPSKIYNAGTQLCLSNEDLCKEITKNAINALKQNPDASFISISQNDWHGYCTCPKCTAIAKEEGSEAGNLLRFVNKVAEEIEKEFPNVYIETLAYQYTRKPPKITRPRKNVVVRLCSIECDFASTLQEGPQNKTFHEDLVNWGKIAPNLFVWDYVTNFSLYLLPFPNYKVWKDNINFYINNHTIGLFEQGDYHLPTGDFIQLRNWVMAKLLWDPSLDQGKLMDEFISGYYAQELVPIFRKYFDLLADTARASEKHIGIFRTSTRDWMTYDTISEITQLFNKAEKIGSELEKKDPVRYKGLQFKLRRERIPLDLVWLQDWNYYRLFARLKNCEFVGPTDPLHLADEFAKKLKENGLTQYRESHGVPIEEFVAGLKEPYLQKGGVFVVPDICKNLPQTSWLDLQQYDFNLSKKGEWTFIENDSTASNGRAIRMPGTHYEWATSWSVNPYLKMLAPVKQEKSEKPLYHLYLYVRCEADTDEGMAMTTGVYDTKGKKGISGKAISVKECKGTAYKMFDYGTTTLEDGSYFWIAPERHHHGLKNVYIDRMIIVREK